MSSLTVIVVDVVFVVGFNRCRIEEQANFKCLFYSNFREKERDTHTEKLATTTTTTKLQCRRQIL